VEKLVRVTMAISFFAMVFVFINSPIPVFGSDTIEEDEPVACIMMCIDDPTTEEVECNSACSTTPLPIDPSPSGEVIEIYSYDEPISLYISTGEEKWIGFKLMAGTYFLENDMWGAMEIYELFAEDLTLIPYNPVNSIQVTIDNSGYYYLHLIANRDVDFQLVFKLDTLQGTNTEPYEGEDTIIEGEEDEQIVQKDGEPLINTSVDDVFETQTEEEAVLVGLPWSDEESASWVFPSLLFLVFSGLIVFKVFKPVGLPK
jgi:hypothetical protein